MSYSTHTPSPVPDFLLVSLPYGPYLPSSGTTLSPVPRGFYHIPSYQNTVPRDFKLRHHLR